MSLTPVDLARILEIPLVELDRISREPRSLHYRYERRLIGKKVRLLRIPVGGFRKIIDRIKENILDPMPLPSTMHGWIKRRSPKSYAKPHLRRSAIFNVDIQDFFPSVSGARVNAFWRRAGFSQDAARILTALTVCDNQLPQGSPTSQAIGNQVLIRLDRRLNRLAALNGANFSMYGDEFTISGRQRVQRLKGLTVRIVEQEGFLVNPKKVKEADRSQRQEIAGIIVNRKPSLGRREYKQLRAIVHNCLKHGPTSQNRESFPNFKGHLRGRISHLQQVNAKLGCA
ncbi:MAG: reverse transcriptase family protein, partial [Candidatus Acidiferrales bacterium]